MLMLAQEFTQGCDGFSPHRFKQIKRSGMVALYERRRGDGSLLGYEAVLITVNKPNSKFGIPGAEIYPKSNAFGRTAYFCTTLERAEIRFVELLAKQSD